MARFSIESVFKAVDKVSAPVSRMQNRINRFTRTSISGMRKLSRSIGKVSSSLARGAKTALKFAGVGLGAITAGVVLLVREFSKIEDAQAAFTPLLGGAEKAKKLVDELNKAAAATPFQFETLAGTANQLLPIMNGNISKTIKTIKMLGDTSGGNAQKLESITRGFTKAMLKGKVDLESLNMIGEAGVPIFQQLASVMGKDVNASFFKMISAGRITTKDLNKAFEKMTSKGGIFFGGMEIASKTTSGIFSTLRDNVSLAAAEIGEALAPSVKRLLTGLIGVAKRVKEWAAANKELISGKVSKFLDTMSSKFGGMSGVVEKMSSFFSSIIEKIPVIVSKLEPLLDSIKKVADGIMKILQFFGLIENKEFKAQFANFGIPTFQGEDTRTTSVSQPKMVSPQERLANTIEEKRQSSTATVTIQDQTGRATVTKGSLSNNIKLENTGGF